MTTFFHMRFLTGTAAFLLTIFSVTAQDFKTYLQDNALRISRTDSLDKSVYNLLSNYELIMLGEMHGTNEPAEFVIALTKLLIANDDSVQVGLEIPSGQMTIFFKEQTDSSIFHSDFFSRTAIDGRENLAWIKIISTFRMDKRVKLFFFDTDYFSGSRDSLMYLNIKKQIQKNPEHKTIILSGNVHNMIIPHMGTTTTACYLKADKELNISDKFCSINHCCRSGTMINNIGKGLEVREVNYDKTIFSAIDSDAYIVLFPKTTTDGYNGVYFTKFVTAAKLINGNR